MRLTSLDSQSWYSSSEACQTNDSFAAAAVLPTCRCDVRFGVARGATRPGPIRAGGCPLPRRCGRSRRLLARSQPSRPQLKAFERDAVRSTRPTTASGAQPGRLTTRSGNTAFQPHHQKTDLRVAWLVQPDLIGATSQCVATIAAATSSIGSEPKRA